MTSSHTKQSVDSQSTPLMDAETLEALRGSIRKWERIVAGTDIDQGCGNCPLCMKFNTHWLNVPARSPNGQCTGCPVAEAVGEHGCEGTPYMEGRFVRTERDGRESYQPTKETAEAELAFLKALLPDALSLLPDAPSDEEQTPTDPDYDGAPYCSDCGARKRQHCKCPPRPRND